MRYEKTRTLSDEGCGTRLRDTGREREFVPPRPGLHTIAGSAPSASALGYVVPSLAGLGFRSGGVQMGCGSVLGVFSTAIDVEGAAPLVF
jgi:hypothetical protein